MPTNKKEVMDQQYNNDSLQSSLRSTESKEEHGTDSSSHGYSPSYIQIVTEASQDTKPLKSRGMPRQISNKH